MNFPPPINKIAKFLSHSLYCDNQICKEVNKKASLYCDKCEANYCESCWKTGHIFGLLQMHSPLSIHQKNNTKYCSTHLHEQMKFYCVPCDQLLCSLCFLNEHQNLLINNNNNNNNNLKEEHIVISMEKASEKMKKELISRSDLILSNRKTIDDRMNENKKRIEEIDIRIASLKGEIEKLEIEKEIISNKLKEDEENSTQIEISNRMIKDMIQSIPSILTVQKKYRDQIDHQISRVFESLYSFPQINNYFVTDPDICILNEQSCKGMTDSFTLSNDGKKFIKKRVGHCGITVKKGISSGKYRWKITYDNPIDEQGWFLIGVQLNKPICSDTSTYSNKETFGMNINSAQYSSTNVRYYIGGKGVATKEEHLKVKKGEELEVIVDCENGIFQLISSTFNPSISIPILLQNQNYFLHFDPYGASFSILSSEKLNK